MRFSLRNSGNVTAFTYVSNTCYGRVGLKTTVHYTDNSTTTTNQPSEQIPSYQNCTNNTVDITSSLAAGKTIDSMQIFGESVYGPSWDNGWHGAFDRVAITHY